MNQRQVKEKLKQAREAINKKQYCDAVTLCQVIDPASLYSETLYLVSKLYLKN